MNPNNKQAFENKYELIKELTPELVAALSAQIGIPFKNRKLGHGNFGKVRICREKKTGKFFAVKIMPLRVDQENTEHSQVEDSKVYQHSVAESRFHQYCKDHRLQGLMLEEEMLTGNKVSKGESIKECVFQVMPIAGAGNGRMLINELEQSIYKETINPVRISDRHYLAQHIARQLVDIFAGMHECRAYNRDFKPDNFLLDINGSVYVCDFGSGVICHQDKSVRIEVGKLTDSSYWPWQHEHSQTKVYQTPDLRDGWCLGLTLLQLVSQEAMLFVKQHLLLSADQRGLLVKKDFSTISPDRMAKKLLSKEELEGFITTNMIDDKFEKLNERGYFFRLPPDQCQAEIDAKIDRLLDGCVSPHLQMVIKGLLRIKPEHRLTLRDAKIKLSESEPADMLRVQSILMHVKSVVSQGMDVGTMLRRTVSNAASDMGHEDDQAEIVSNAMYNDYKKVEAVPQAMKTSVRGRESAELDVIAHKLVIKLESCREVLNSRGILSKTDLYSLRDCSARLNGINRNKTQQDIDQAKKLNESLRIKILLHDFRHVLRKQVMLATKERRSSLERAHRLFSLEKVSRKKNLETVIHELFINHSKKIHTLDEFDKVLHLLENKVHMEEGKLSKPKSGSEDESGVSENDYPSAPHHNNSLLDIINEFRSNLLSIDDILEEEGSRVIIRRRP